MQRGNVHASQQRRMEKKGFKNVYDNDDKFYEFINQCSALSHLPIEDIEAGLNHIEVKFVFEYKEATEFIKKQQFLSRT